MSINFEHDPSSCATFGYSFDYTCPTDNIVHKIDQNWRVMVDPVSGATFYAPVTTVASISSTQGPPGDQGLTGVTGMTGMTGEDGLRGPQGLSFGSSVVGRQSGIVFLPSDAVNEPGPDGITLDATEDSASVIFENGIEYFKVDRVREALPAAGTTTTISNGFQTINVAEGNNFKLNINTSFDGITLTNMKVGDYVNIIMVQSGNPPALFKSDFVCSGYSNTTTKHASGITYNNGLNGDDVDVFYVSCIFGNGSNEAALLVNHQRYHNGS